MKSLSVDSPIGHRLRAGIAAAACALLASWLMPMPASADSPSPDAGRQRRRTPVVEVFESRRGAVVNIASTKLVEIRRGFGGGFFEDFFEPPQRQYAKTQSVGSGFIIHADGYIVTNAHVVAQTVERKIIFADGTSLDAEEVAIDPAHDLAVLKVQADKPLPYVPLGRSDDLMIGETVVAIGNPLGYQNTCTAGIVSALNRELELRPGMVYRGLIQTDTSINPGNSGGPLLNINGELIGINSAIRGDAQNIGFAIPVNALRQLLPQMLDIERIRRVRLGAHFSELPDADHAPLREGAHIAKVDPESPAAKAGLKPGDRIVGINQDRTANFLDAFSYLRRAAPGQQLEFAVRRGGKTLQRPVTLAEIPKPDGSKLMQQRFGLTVREMTAAELKRYELRRPVGLVVTRVASNSPAAKTVDEGDFVTKIGGVPTLSLDEVGHLLEENVSPGDVLEFSLLRVDGNTIYTGTIRLRAQ